MTIHCLVCESCGKSDETVRITCCGYVQEIYGEYEEETVCDDCEYQHCQDV